MNKDLVVVKESVFRDGAISILKGILAGIMIAIGGTIYLSCTNKIVGAFLFAIGLFLIVTRGFNLYTGKVGYIVDKKPKYLIEVITTLIGNFIGTFIIGFLLRFTRIYIALNKKAIELCEIKLGDNILSILLLSVFCGILMYLAVDGYKKVEDSLGKYLGVFLGVAVFILCGFEHSIANMYYFSVASIWSLKVAGYLLIMILGNAVGGIFIPAMYKIIKCIEKRRVKLWYVRGAFGLAKLIEVTKNKLEKKIYKGE